MPAKAPAPSWRETFAAYTTPILPEMDLVFTVRVDPDYYYCALAHAVVKAKGDFTEEKIQAFVQDALTSFYEAHKGKQQPASPEALALAEASVPGPSHGRTGKALRIDLSGAVKRETATRLVLHRYGANLEAGKRAFTKEAIFAKLQATLLAPPSADA